MSNSGNYYCSLHLVHALLGRYSYRAVYNNYFGSGTARLGEWRLNHIHSINSAEFEVINASCSDSSAEIDMNKQYTHNINVTVNK